MFLVVSAPLGGSYERVHTHANRTPGRALRGRCNIPELANQAGAGAGAVTAARGAGTQDRLSPAGGVPGPPPGRGPLEPARLLPAADAI
jgi:hypothetical protein